MKTITIYESTDGRRFDDISKCEASDILDAKVKEIEATLPKLPNSSSVRVAVSIKLVKEAKERVVKLCRQEYPREEIFKRPASEIHPLSFASRLLDECGGPLNRVWRWFCCERDGWLYEQPYFAMNPDKFRGNP